MSDIKKPIEGTRNTTSEEAERLAGLYNDMQEHLIKCSRDRDTSPAEAITVLVDMVARLSHFSDVEPEKIVALYHYSVERVVQHEIMDSMPGSKETWN